MTFARIATAVGIAVLTLFLAAVVVAGPWGVGTGILTVVAIVGLIGGGSMLYGRRSRYAAITERKRPAQEAHDHAAAVAADARRAAGEAAKRGERYCPLDPAQTQADARAHAPTNGHTPAPHPASPPPHPA